ncbi:hypothetical protein GCM10010191_60380 [Actinomadura vinacea]|uniref:Uncharacterized protein n=1 Tax=Actinomadura vinacea TaxID=115336 RepID=A0ABN3JT98_9ACTN
MNSRLCILSGAGILIASLLGLAVYWGQVGFRMGDTLGWVGAALGIAGLILAIYGIVAGDKRGSSEDPARVEMNAEASGEGRVYQAGRDQTINEK